MEFFATGITGPEMADLSFGEELGRFGGDEGIAATGTAWAAKIAAELEREGGRAL
jgi:hypothetical protein